MSPPCQPYTVQGEQRDKKDPRAAGTSSLPRKLKPSDAFMAALIHLTQVLAKMRRPPRRLLLEVLQQPVTVDEVCCVECGRFRGFREL